MGTRGGEEEGGRNLRHILLRACNDRKHSRSTMYSVTLTLMGRRISGLFQAYHSYPYFHKLLPHPTPETPQLPQPPTIKRPPLGCQVYFFNSLLILCEIRVVLSVQSRQPQEQRSPVLQMCVMFQYQPTAHAVQRRNV